MPLESDNKCFVLSTGSNKHAGGGGGVLAMFAYEGVHAMFLGLKFHLKAIFWV